MADEHLVISSGASSPEEVANRSFPTVFRGFDQSEVRAFLHRVSEELSTLASRERELRRALQEALARAAHPVLDEEALTAALGDHAARLLSGARETGSAIRSEAEAEAARVLAQAEEDAARLRSEAETLLARRVEEADAVATSLRQAAEADARTLREQAQAEAEAEIEAARTRGREMVAEAKAVRERVLADLVRRRRQAQMQIEQLRAARDRLLEAYRVVRRTLDEATEELQVAESEARLAAEAAARRVAPDAELSRELEAAELMAAGVTPREEAADRAGAVPAGPGVAERGGAGQSAAPVFPQPLSPPADAGVSPAPVGAPSAPGTSAAPVAGPDDEAVEDGAASDATTAGSGNDAIQVIGRSPEAPAGAVGPTEVGDGEAASERRGEVVTVDEGVPSPAPGPAAVAPPPAEEAEEAEGPLAQENPAAASPPDVDDLFARLRAGQAAGAVPAPPGSPSNGDGAPEPTAGAGGAESAGGAGGPEEGTSGAGDEAALFRRDELLEPIESDLVRQVKRLLQDDQNQILDRVRSRGRSAPSAALPDVAEQTERYQRAVVPVLEQAAREGARFSGMEDVDEAAVRAAAESCAADLAVDLVLPLRERLDRALAESAEEDDDEAELLERLSAGYRQWKTQHVEELARHHAASAFAEGAFAAVPEGRALRWVVDDDGPCPDCDDNALAGPNPRGQAYPTGQLHPPSHVGCRCLLLPVPT